MRRFAFLILCVALLWSAPRTVDAQFPNLPPPVDIPIQNIQQETPVWCWAAVSQQIIMASVGQGGTPPQCALVAMANGAPPQVCCSGYNQACVRTGSIPQIMGLISQFGHRAVAYAPPTDPMTLYQTLQQRRAVILQIRSGPMSTHVIVVRGMFWQPTPYGVQPMLIVNDPMAQFTQPVPFQNIMAIWIDAVVIA